jgi:methyltransferase (TIGR00027 family)
MIAGQPSATAERAAIRRASHQLLDDPVVFSDPLALTILGPDLEAALRRDPRSFETPWSRPLRAFLAARSRYAEDALSHAVERGVRQYVVLGAGLDTFAYRGASRSIGLHVFEVDCPATQEWKLARLLALGIPIASSVSFVSHDFETGDIAASLAGSGFDAARPAVFAWLGVTPYLTANAIHATLRSVARAGAEGSELVFDFCNPPSSLSRVGQRAFEGLARRLRERGEPWLTFFEPSDLERDVRQSGFSRLEILDPKEIHSRYFGARPDRLTVGLLGHLAHAHI